MYRQGKGKSYGPRPSTVMRSQPCFQGSVVAAHAKGDCVSAAVGQSASLGAGITNASTIILMAIASRRDCRVLEHKDFHGLHRSSRWVAMSEEKDL